MLEMHGGRRWRKELSENVQMGVLHNSRKGGKSHVGWQCSLPPLSLYLSPLLFLLWGIYSERNTIRSLSFPLPIPSPAADRAAAAPPSRRLIFLISQMTGAQSPGSLPLSRSHAPPRNRQCHNHSFALLPLIAKPHSSSSGGGRLYQQKAAATMLREPK